MSPPRSLVVVAAVLVGGVSAVSRAQLPDAELTPVAKAPTQWSVFGGAKFGQDGDLFNGQDSPTPFTVDFFSTAFSPEYLDNQVGFFGGAECVATNGRAVEFSEVEECDPQADLVRRPAIYRFWVDEMEEQHIDRMALIDESVAPADQRGFVGAIAWLDSERALAVGGTGRYPRREPPAQSGGDAAYAAYDREHWAGEARAWLYEDPDGAGPKPSAWRELSGDELPGGMSALTALDCSPKQDGRCVAGGMQQLWRWGPATPPAKPTVGFESAPEAVAPLTISTTTTTDGLTGPTKVPTPLSDFHYRVRQVRYKPTGGSGADPEVVAVTSGCCGGRGDAESTRAPGGARLLSIQPNGIWKSESFSQLGGEDASAVGAPLPDSYYGVVYSPNAGGYNEVIVSSISAIAAAGSDPGQGGAEPGSRIVVRQTGQGVATGPIDPDVTDRKLDEIRLLAADGDTGSMKPPTGSLSDVITRTSPDGMLDWAVGSFKNSQQGVAYTTMPPVLALPTPLTCTLGLGTLSDQGSNCDLEMANVTDADLSSRRLLAMGTYALNAVSFVPGTTTAWAAGDRGAVARLGGAGALGGATEPDAPALEAGTATPLSERQAFDPFRVGVGSGRPGLVPPLAERPLEQLPARTLVPWGTADASRYVFSRPPEMPVALAMSRDGSEGWAVGKGLALQHFDGERWARCDIDGLSGVYAPDPACEMLRPLPDDPAARMDLLAVARVPLERDGDPSNDDDFAATAIGIDGSVLRYRSGRWEPDPGASLGSTGNPAMAQVAFRAPDDGWALTGHLTGTLYRYGGGDWPDGEWIKCPIGGCGDSGSLLPHGTADSRGTISELRVAGDTVFVAGTRLVGGSGGSGVRYPFVLSKTGDGPWRQDYDPGCPRPGSAGECASQDAGQDPDTQAAVVSSLSVVDLGGGRIAGWLLGEFGRSNAPLTGEPVPLTSEPDEFTQPVLGPRFVLIRRDPGWSAASAAPGTGPWTFRDVKDAAADQIPITGNADAKAQLVSVRGGDGHERSFIMPSSRYGDVHYPPLEYEPATDRWEVLRAPFVSSTNFSGGVETATQGRVITAAPDERGGIWVAARSSQHGSSPPIGSHAATYFYRDADVRRREVFEEAPNPVAEPISGLAGTPDGAVWVSTESDAVYHYDRIGGWERARVKGWDRGRVVTRPSKAFAVAVNDAGIGVAVGEDGRIVDLSPESVVLDPASGRRCSDVVPPCGTPRDLRAAAVAPDGSAMAGGDHLALMWRPAGGPFRTIETPRVASATRVTGISMPARDHAWVTLDQGEIWAGTGMLVGDRWRWRWERESTTEAARDERTGEERFARLTAIRVQSDGRGLAVGFRGAMLERSVDGTWQRIKTGYVDNLHAIAFPPSGYGDGTLVGGDMGEILTRIDGRYRLARQTDFTDPLAAATNNVLSGRVVGLALSGGSADGDVEAWAASQLATDFPGNFLRDPAPSALLHYGSGDPLLEPRDRALPLPDAPAVEAGEVTLAAFGRSECQLNNVCPPFQGTNLFNEVVTRRIQVELRKRRQEAGGAFAALFTGDINVAPGRDEENRRTASTVTRTHTLIEPNVAHDQWRDLVARPLMESGIPTFAAVGRTDLSRARACDPGTCTDTQEHADAGVSAQWRETFAGMSAPWGSGSELVPTDDVELVPVADPGPSLAAPDQTVQPEESLPAVQVRAGARTHYALDMVRNGSPVVRLVFVDNSFARSLSASEGSQNPIEAAGGQAAWVERVLCIRGETCAASVAAAAGCVDGATCPAGTLRAPGLATVVVSNAPTYSYGPGGLDATQSDGSLLETLLLRHRVTAVVSGRLGWNGLFYTLAAGLHAPCPGGSYPQRPPTPAEGLCAGEASGSEVPGVPGASVAADALRGLGAPLPPQVEDAVGTADGLRAGIPNVVAASAGGRFGPRGEGVGSASEGYWHGYSIVRLQKSGAVIVEQRPILDWVGIEGSEHTLRPGQRMALHGFGREPYGTDTSFRRDEIDSPAITHRFDLLEADPERPYLPRVVEGNGNPHGYVMLDPSVGQIDDQTGRVTAARGNHGRVYALAVLSVGEHVATYPLLFEPKRSYTAPKQPRLSVPVVPEVRVLSFNASSINTPTSPPPNAPPPPLGVNLQVPTPPSIPTFPPAATPPVAPPVPPAPPAPPGGQTSTPISLSINPAGLTVPPTTGVTAQPTPPVNPSPPGGARKEARQRQAATAKSEEGAGEGVDPQDSHATVNPGDSPNSYIRRDENRHAFTALSSREQPSALGRDALYGGGTLLMALILFLGWTGVRPTPRRRESPAPAPAWARRPRRWW